MTARITIDGNLVADPDFGVGDSGTSWAHLRVASHERIRRDGEWVSTDPEFYNVTLFGAAAETAANDLHKGDRVTVAGPTAAGDVRPPGRHPRRRDEGLRPQRRRRPNSPDTGSRPTARPGTWDGTASHRPWSLSRSSITPRTPPSWSVSPGARPPCTRR